MSKPSSAISTVDQMEFVTLFTIPGKNRWTRAIEIYDSMPKYLYKKNKKMQVAAADTYHEANFIVDGNPCTIRLVPARVTFKNKKGFYAYPGEREELVARAIRYLGVQENAHITTERAQGTSKVSFHFTLGQVQTLLAQWKKTFSKTEIREALEILRGSELKITFTQVQEKKEQDFTGNLIAEIIRENDKYLIVLNSMEAAYLQQGRYRALNFERLMALRDPLARRLYELVMTQHTGAEKPSKALRENRQPKPYELRMSTVLVALCIEPEKSLRNTVGRIRRALQALTLEGVLWRDRPFEERIEKEKSAGGRPSIKDVVWRVYLSDQAVSDIIAAHLEVMDGDLSKARGSGNYLAYRKEARHRLP